MKALISHKLDQNPDAVKSISEDKNIIILEENDNMLEASQLVALFHFVQSR